MQKDETRSLSHTIYKTKKWTKNLNIRPETIKLLEGNSIFFNISINNIFRTYLISQGGGKKKNKQKQKTQMGLSSVAQSCLILCDPMDYSTPGFPVHHQLPEFTQTHVHWFGDAIQPSHPLTSPPSAFILSWHQGLFK